MTSASMPSAARHVRGSQGAWAMCDQLTMVTSRPSRRMAAEPMGTSAAVAIGDVAASQ